MTMRGSGKLLLALAFATLIPSLVAAGKGFRLRPPLTRDADDQPLERVPARRRVSDIFAIVNNTWLRRLSLEKALEEKGPSLNVNAWDEVPDSTWFTNRMGLRSPAFGQIVGTLEGKPPGPFPWRVRKRNDSGYTPKVDITVGNDNYVLKFDPTGARERNSAAERIGTLILHAAGYNVPFNAIVEFRIEDLDLTGATYEDPFGNEMPLTDEHLKAVFESIQPMPNGRYRGIASLRLPAPTLGPFVFTGKRQDDANDIIPHEMRRELRGLRVIASWINHVDIKDAQALDVWVPAGEGRGFVKHYLLDFSATLGAYEWPIAPFRVGHEYMFDGDATGKAFVTLGFKKRPWESLEMNYPNEVGYFSAELFEPEKWKPSFPNLAFEQMDDSDGYWGAKIVTAFTNEMIRSISAEGQFVRDEVTRYVYETLVRRRDAIGKYWLNRVTPLEEPRLEFIDSNYRLQFRDLAYERGHNDLAARTYRFWVETLDGTRVSDYATASAPNLEIEGLSQLVAKYPGGPSDEYGRTPRLRIVIQSNQRYGKWAVPAEVFIGQTRSNPNLQVLGWSHAPSKVRIP